jgi:hypothetical protein
MTTRGGQMPYVVPLPDYSMPMFDQMVLAQYPPNPQAMYYPQVY